MRFHLYAEPPSPDDLPPVWTLNQLSDEEIFEHVKQHFSLPSLRREDVIITINRNETGSIKFVNDPNIVYVLIRDIAEVVPMFENIERENLERFQRTNGQTGKVVKQ